MIKNLHTFTNVIILILKGERRFYFNFYISQGVYCSIYSVKLGFFDLYALQTPDNFVQKNNYDVNPKFK